MYKDLEKKEKKNFINLDYSNNTPFFKEEALREMRLRRISERLRLKKVRGK